MFNKKYTSTICRQQDIDFAGFFVDKSLQEFCIKSNGKIIKKFIGRILMPVDLTETSNVGWKAVFATGLVERHRLEALSA